MKQVAAELENKAKNLEEIVARLQRDLAKKQAAERAVSPTAQRRPVDGHSGSTPEGKAAKNEAKGSGKGAAKTEEKSPIDEVPTPEPPVARKK